MILKGENHDTCVTPRPKGKLICMYSLYYVMRSKKCSRKQHQQQLQAAAGVLVRSRLWRRETGGGK